MREEQSNCPAWLTEVSTRPPSTHSLARSRFEVRGSRFEPRGRLFCVGYLIHRTHKKDPLTPASARLALSTVVKKTSPQRDMRTRFCATPVSQISNGRHAGQSPPNCLTLLSGGCGWLERTPSLAGNTVVVTPPPPPKAIACRGGRRRRHAQDSCHIVSPPDASSRSVRAQEIWPQASGDATHVKETCGICTGVFFDGSCALSPQPQQEITQLHVPENIFQGGALLAGLDTHTRRACLKAERI